MSKALAPFLCVVVAGLLGAAAFSLSSRGHPVTLPLDDAYIYLQYARTALDGDLGAYAPGEPATNGMTSPLWFGLVTAAGAVQRAVPGVPDNPAAGALFLCLLSAGLMLTLAYRLARAHGAGPAGAWAAMAVCLLSPLWFFGAFNGMETALYSAALLGGALTLAGGSLWWLVPLALVRPEGAAAALVLLGAALVRRPRDGGVSMSRRHARALVVMGAAVFALAFPRIIADAPSAAWEAKAMWAEPDPEVRAFYYPRLPYFAARTLWFGMSGARPQPPLDLSDAWWQWAAWPEWIWVLFLGGGTFLAVAGGRARGPLALWGAVSLASLVAVAWDAHFYRYLIPAYPLLAVTATAGWFGASWRRRGETEAGGVADGETQNRTVPGSGSVGALVRRLAGGAVLLAAAVAAFGMGDYAGTVRRLYRGECERVAAYQVETGRWLREHAPPGARVAVHDAGAIAFVGERTVVDLVGLVTPGFAGASRRGEGALWEAMDALPPPQRPAYAAVIPAWMPYLSRTLLFSERLWSAGRSSGGRQPVSRHFEVWRLAWPGEDPVAWPGGDFGNRPRLHGAPAGEPHWKIADAVDVAHLPSELSHAYRDDGGRSTTEVRDLGFAGDPRRTHALEGGRTVKQTVRFRSRLEGGRAARLVVRSTSPAGAELTVRVGSWSAPLTVPRGEGRFAEPSVLVPAEHVQPEADGTVAVAVEGAGYRAYHWWWLQRD